MSGIRRPRPLTFREVVDTLAAVDSALANLLLIPRTRHPTRTAIERIRTEMIGPILRRNGRR